MFHFPWFAPHPLCIQGRVFQVYWNRLPNSEIPGSKPVSGSPRLIAACHVLHRLLMPRHPPYALISLTIKFASDKLGIYSAIFASLFLEPFLYSVFKEQFQPLLQAEN